MLRIHDCCRSLAAQQPPRHEADRQDTEADRVHRRGGGRRHGWEHLDTPRHFGLKHVAQIRTVKEKIEADKGEEYYADGLKLIFSGAAYSVRPLPLTGCAGKILTDAQTVAEYNIKETDFLVVMPGKVWLFRLFFATYRACSRAPWPRRPPSRCVHFACLPARDRLCAGRRGRAGPRHTCDTRRCSSTHPGVCSCVRVAARHPHAARPPRRRRRPCRSRTSQRPSSAI